MKLIFVSGISGSGKSLCLNALEDLNIYCIDNLPAGLVPALIEHNKNSPQQSMGVSIDARNIDSLKKIHGQLNWLNEQEIDYSIIFLEATDDEIIKRYKETRRKHPILNSKYSLIDAITLERSLLKDIKENADFVIDTTQTTPHQLRRQIRDYIVGNNEEDFTIRIESFGYKHGIPRDADFVFDVRCLPNPHWDKSIRHLTGKDLPVINFFHKEPSVEKMTLSIRDFIANWIGSFKEERRSHITLAIGCTGGKHRSVYITETLAKSFEEGVSTQTHHRDITQTT